MNKFNLFRSYGYALFARRAMSTPPVPPSPEGNAMGSISAKYKPSEFQKFILVWTKKYKTKDEIPNYVSPDVIERSQSQARIKVANVLILLTALASFGAILSGKAAAKRGESVHQINKDWHKQYQEEYKQTEGSTK